MASTVSLKYLSAVDLDRCGYPIKISWMISINSKFLVPRYFQWERGGLDAHRMMTGDDTGGDVWTVAGAW
jgi:hypothetical protein